VDRTVRKSAAEPSHDAPQQARAMKWNWPLWRSQRDTTHAEAILRERRESGSIDDVEFRYRLAVLRTQPARTHLRAIIALTAVGVLALAAAAAGLAYAAQNLTPPSLSAGRTTSCSVPQLSGQVVAVTLTDMGMMQGWMMAGHGTGRVVVSSSRVHPGTVSLRVSNMGALVHELVVLPLTSGSVGDRIVGADDRVAESGSMGEASATCAAGAGQGISSGAVGWVTLHLPAGRYELVCNLPGHYAAGMYAEMDVTL
jgi:uncharacterized cupredoxin-like copper-binding protein